MVLTVVELRIGKESHKVRAVSGLDMVTLEVDGNVAEGLRVSVNVECSYRR